jgi:putative nucleotidyltransferase with HDIG domain
MKLKKELEELFDILAQAQERGYIGEPISQLEHALQSAKLATDGNGRDELILAALFHDIGHLCAEEKAPCMDKFGIDNHHGVGAEYLRSLGFSDTVATLIKGHVDAKRYLVAKKTNYLHALSPASQETLRHQGGPMSKEEMHAFESHPLFQEMLLLRTCDDRAKRVGWDVPTLDCYHEVANRHLCR